MTQQQLEKFLWGAATKLRGLIDGGDYKQFTSLQNVMHQSLKVEEKFKTILKEFI